MSDFGPTNTHEALSRLAKLSATSEPSVAGSSSGAGAAPPPLPAFSPNWSAPVPTPKHARRPKVRRLLANRRSGRVAAAALICAAIGLPISVATSPSATAAQLVSRQCLRGRGIQRSVGAGPRWSIRHGRHVCPTRASR